MSSPRKSLCHEEAQRCFFVIGLESCDFVQKQYCRSPPCDQARERRRWSTGGTTAKGITSRELPGLDVRHGMGSYGC